MTAEQTKKFDEIVKLYEKASNLTNDYWQSYSHLGTWQFWFLAAILILPLVVLYFLLDKKKAFHIGFFGFSVHMLFHYFDTYFFMHRLASFPYKIVPFLPTGVALEVSLVPVAYMLVYQWTLNKSKNYYLYVTGLSLLLAFLFKPAMVAFGLFKMYKGINYFHLFLVYIIVMLLSKWITNVFLYFQKGADDAPKRDEVKKPRKLRSFLSRVFHIKQKAK